MGKRKDEMYSTTDSSIKSIVNVTDGSGFSADIEEDNHEIQGKLRFLNKCILCDSVQDVAGNHSLA